MDPHYRNNPPRGSVTWREFVVIMVKSVAMAIAIVVPAWAIAHYGYLYFQQ